MTTLRQAAQEFVSDYDCGGCGHFQYYAERFRTVLRAALEQPEQDAPETDCGNIEWADIPKEFNDWWDADRLTQTNPFREDSPAYWAWEGWQARAALTQQEPDLRNANPIGLTPPQKALQREQFRAAALAEPVQEPVAWRTFDGEGGYDYRTYNDNENYRDEWDRRNPNHKGWVEPLYTAPPRREWRSLSGEEINALPEVGGRMWNMGVADAVLRAIRAIEQALRSKNHG
jgi:hypothetical protein